MNSMDMRSACPWPPGYWLGYHSHLYSESNQTKYRKPMVHTLYENLRQIRVEVL